MSANVLKTILYKFRRIIEMVIVLEALLTRTATKIFFTETNHNWLKRKFITATAVSASRARQELFAYPFAHANHRAPQPQRATLSLSYFSQPICLTLPNCAEEAAGEEDGNEYQQHNFRKLSSCSFSERIDKTAHIFPVVSHPNVDRIQTNRAIST